MYSLETLINRLNEITLDCNTESCVQAVKRELERAIQEGFELPAEYREQADTCADGDGYTRRSVHEPAHGRYSIIAMIWGIGQGTSLHDHANLWCVDCVIDGKIEVVPYDLEEEKEGEEKLYRFSPGTPIYAGPGEAGALIPPFEYHTIANSLDGAKSVSLHVYGGKMERASLFHEVSETPGWYRKEVCARSCDS